MRILTCAILLAVLGEMNTVRANQRPCTVPAPCRTETGSYLLAFPESWNGKDALPVVVFFHGHASSSKAVMRNTGLVNKFTRRGYLLIAPNGSARAGRPQRGWPAHRRAAGRRDDIAFMRDVLVDVTGRVPVNRDRILVTGFSSGGSMAWFLACFSKDRFAAYAPVSGALRRPIPDEKCPEGPFDLLHIHGFADAQVPLEGRGIREWNQGDVFEGLSVLRETNGCRSHPVRFSGKPEFQCREWSGCSSGKAISFCLHPRGHTMPKGWATAILDWFEGV
ncbi:MAG: alpha/beta hydrolase family esterase [Hyphomicrobiaceae bacterium]